ncbi:hypothetical protein D3C78_998320 [compost metagenome]
MLHIPVLPPILNDLYRLLMIMICRFIHICRSPSLKSSRMFGITVLDRWSIWISWASSHVLRCWHMRFTLMIRRLKYLLPAVLPSRIIP